MFDEDRPEYNGELAFYQDIRPHIKTIFDVGSRDSSLFMDFEGEVHYFDPRSDFIDSLEKQPCRNTRSYFNRFGLGLENTKNYYYPRFESFYDRIESCYTTDVENRIELEIRRGDEYMQKNQIETIDFLKIDTEGHEFSVLAGFDDYLSKIKIIQFEYGGVWIDSHTKLTDAIGVLRAYGFDQFSYLAPEGSHLVPIPENVVDDYRFCNIVCMNSAFDSIGPFDQARI